MRADPVDQRVALGQALRRGHGVVGIPEAQQRLSEPDLGAPGQGHAIDAGPRSREPQSVVTVQIDQDQGAVGLSADHGVPRRDGSLVEDQAVVVAAADRERQALHGHALHHLAASPQNLDEDHRLQRIASRCRRARRSARS